MPRPSNSGAEQRRRVFFGHRDNAIANHVLPAGEPMQMTNILSAAGAFSETNRYDTVPFVRSSCSRQYSLHPHPGSRIFARQAPALSS